MTLNLLIDDILLELRNSNIAESELISRILIELWIHSYRAMLIKLDIDKGRDVNPMYIQTLQNIEINKVEDIAGHEEYVSDITLPKLIDFHYRTGLLAVRDMFGNPILLGTEYKMKYQKYRKYTCKDYIAYLKNNKIYVEGGNNQLQYIEADLIVEDPTSLTPCYDPDTEYPVPANMIPTIKQLIFQNELNIMPIRPSDNTNDSNDDLQNKYSTETSSRTRRLNAA